MVTTKRLIMILNIILFLIISVTLFLIGDNMAVIQYQALAFKYDSASCDGIDYFFTNYSFKYDEQTMNEYYRKCYNSTETMIEDTFRVYPPRFLYECDGSGYDCDDYAFTVTCLADLYNINCSIYAQNEYDEVQKHSRHIGVNCYFEDYGWRRIN